MSYPRHRTDHGNIIEYWDCGRRYFTDRQGNDMDFCERCEELRLSTDLDDDGICSDCRAEIAESEAEDG